MKKILLFGAALMMAAVSMAQTPTVSASSVTFKYCQTTYGTETISFYDNPTWSETGETFPAPGVYVRTIQNSRGCDSIVTLNVVPVVNAIAHNFSVSANKRVWFARGNLQYCPNPATGPKTHATRTGTASGIWRIAPNPWDVAGDGNYVNRTTSYAGWIDIFPAAASGSDADRTPLKDQCLAADVKPTGNCQKNNMDPGYFNAISNAGNTPEKWYMLTQPEWTYLLSERASASSKYSWGIVNGVKGMIILPDTWTIPSGLSFTSGRSYSNAAANTYNIDAWTRMEEAGAVFLPSPGFDDSCIGRGGDFDDRYFGYWTATRYDYQGYFYRVYYNGTSATTVTIDRVSFQRGYAVRLVRDSH